MLPAEGDINEFGYGEGVNLDAEQNTQKTHSHMDKLLRHDQSIRSYERFACRLDTLLAVGCQRDIC